MALSVAQTADAGAPQAGITIDGLSTGTGCNITLTVSWDGGTTWNPVRGGLLTGILGSTYVRDYVTPLNVTATYKAVVTGGTTATWTATSTINSTYMWIQDPLAPRSAVAVAASTPINGVLYLLSPSFGPLSRSQPADYATPMGASLAVASVGVRQKPTSIPFSIQGAQSQVALLTALRSMLSAAGQLVLRGIPPLVPLDAVLHVVAQVSESSAQNIADSFNTFEFSAIQVRPVATRIVIPWWTFDQVLALVQSQISGGATTNAQVLAAQPSGKTYTQWLANPGVAP